MNDSHARYNQRYEKMSRTAWAGNLQPGSIIRSYPAPWGIEPLAGLPTPPFASKGEHQAFLDALRLHIAALGGIDGGLPAAILNSLFESVDLGKGTLSNLELRVCLQSFFPAPWEPGDLARLISAVPRSQPGTLVPTSNAGFTRIDPTPEGGWRWFGDPDFEAAPAPDGGWLLLRHERGWFEEDRIEGEYDLCLFMMAMSSRSSWGTNEFALERAKGVTIFPDTIEQVREAAKGRFNVARGLENREPEGHRPADEEPLPTPTGWFKKLFDKGDANR